MKNWYDMTPEERLEKDFENFKKEYYKFRDKAESYFLAIIAIIIVSLGFYFLEYKPLLKEINGMHKEDSYMYFAIGKDAYEEGVKEYEYWQAKRAEEYANMDRDVEIDTGDGWPY